MAPRSEGTFVHFIELLADGRLVYAALMLLALAPLYAVDFRYASCGGSPLLRNSFSERNERAAG